MIGWQPIETAPKDGTDILVAYEFASVWIAHIAWYRSREGWEDDWKPEHEGWWSYIENSVSQHKLEGFNAPTHWMPFKEPT